MAAKNRMLMPKNIAWTSTRICAKGEASGSRMSENRRSPKSGSRNRMRRHRRILLPATTPHEIIRHALAVIAGQDPVTIEEIAAVTVAAIVDVDVADVGDVVAVEAAEVVGDVIRPAAKLAATFLPRNTHRRKVVNATLVATKIAGLHLRSARQAHCHRNREKTTLCCQESR